MRTIAIVNQKGGCGKTTTAISLAGALARSGLDTLLIDLDPQGHCAAGLAIPEKRIDLTTADAMLAPPDKPPDPARLLWRVSRGLDLMPCTMRLAGLEAPRGGLIDAPDRETRLADAIERITGAAGGHARYEWCVIDCPPSIGLLTFNALVAATEALIPVETGFFSCKGASRQVGTIRSLASRLGVARDLTLLPTLHDPENAVSRAMLEGLRASFGELVAPFEIRLDPSLREAVSLGQTIAEHAPRSVAAADYQRLANWLLERPVPRADALRPRARSDAPPSMPAQRGAPDPEPPTPAEAPAAADAVLTRAAELAARVRVLALRSEAYQARLATTERGVEPATPARAENGPRVTPEGARFVCHAHPASRVFVAGDFNSWSPTSHPLAYAAASGVFVAVIPLSPGRRLYRLVIDGRWETDPLNPETHPNSFGDLDSVLLVRPDSPRAEAPEVIVRPVADAIAR